MKLNANTIDSWLKAIPSSLRFMVIYGQDLGQVRIISDKFVKTLSSSSEINVINLSYDDIKNSSATLNDEMASLSLLGDRKILVISDVGASISKEIQEILKNPKGDAIVIFLAEELKPSSNLRKLAETSEIGASIACYRDEPRVLQGFIRSYLTEHKVAFDNDVPAYLSEILPPNRLLILNELEKLITYSSSQNKPIEVEEIEQVVGDASELGLDDLCMALVTKNKALMQKQISKIVSEDANFVFILRVLLRYIMRILEVYAATEQSKSIEQGVSSLTPPVFFKQKDNLIKIIKSVPAPHIKTTLKKLLQLELDCKNTRVDPQVLVCNFLTQAV